MHGNDTEHEWEKENTANMERQGASTLRRSDRIQARKVIKTADKTERRNHAKSSLLPAKRKGNKQLDSLTTLQEQGEPPGIEQAIEILQMSDMEINEEIVRQFDEAFESQTVSLPGTPLHDTVPPHSVEGEASMIM
jgi:hypothetical protein